MSDLRVLFVGQAFSRASWYRVCLPGLFGSWDWVGIAGQPPNLQVAASWVGQATGNPDFLSYDVVVLQQVRGNKWLGLIRKLREHGVTVLYEVDDYLHEIVKSVDHDFSQHYREPHLKATEKCMRSCDGVIFSTKYLASQYDRFARRSWVCENGLDLGRYRLTRPRRGEVAGRETVTVLWAGGTGHQVAVIPWIKAVSTVMRELPHVTFVSVGQDFAALLEKEFPDRTLSIPFTSLECYTGAMMTGDVSIAPAGKSKWFQAKSDLRAMESQALGIPVIADSHYRNSVVEGETGLIVYREGDIVPALRKLLRDDDRRVEMSARAREYAHETFGMQARIGQWESALEEARRVCT